MGKLPECLAGTPCPGKVFARKRNRSATQQLCNFRTTNLRMLREERLAFPVIRKRQELIDLVSPIVLLSGVQACSLSVPPPAVNGLSEVISECDRAFDPSSTRTGAEAGSRAACS